MGVGRDAPGGRLNVRQGRRFDAISDGIDGCSLVTHRSKISSGIILVGMLALVHVATVRPDAG
jgi:hypothetical protein